MAPNRREILSVGLAGAAGLLGVAVPRAAAHTGILGDAELKKFATAPKSRADFRKLADHFEALRKDAEKEAAFYEGLAKTYRKGIAGCTEFQAHDAARAIEHVAEHARDTAEALEHLVETYKGLEENFSG